MTQPDDGTQQPVTDDLVDAQRSGTRLVVAATVCCAALPLGVLAFVVLGGASVPAWAWALLIAAVLAAATMVVRVAR